MAIQSKLFSWVSAFIAVLLLVSSQARAEQNRVTFPDISQLTHYTTVTRGEVTEHIMTTPEAIEAVQSGQSIPNDTHVVLVDYRDNEVYRYFVMQKGEGWGGDYDERRRTGDWQFQWFWADQTINMDENTARCQSCHESREEREFIYTFNDLRRYE